MVTGGSSTNTQIQDETGPSLHRHDTLTETGGHNGLAVGSGGAWLVVDNSSFQRTDWTHKYDYTPPGPQYLPDGTPIAYAGGMSEHLDLSGRIEIQTWRYAGVDLVSSVTTGPQIPMTYGLAPTAVASMPGDLSPQLWVNPVTFNAQDLQQIFVLAAQIPAAMATDMTFDMAAGLDKFADMAGQAVFNFLVKVGEDLDSLDKQLSKAMKDSGYSNKFYAALGEFYIRPTIGDERLARPGTKADDLKLALMLANDLVSWVDPTGVTDVIGGALDISEGNYLAGALRMSNRDVD